MDWKHLIVCCAILGLTIAIEKIGKKHNDGHKYMYKVKWYDQKVDHFSLVKNSTFKQRYLFNDTYWKKGEDGHEPGPIFFYTGNEGDIEAFAMNTGFMWDIAPEFNAMIVFAEHRYYGKSLPFGKASTQPNPAYNGYLTSEQALGDYAELLTFLRANITGLQNAPIISFGGSYGGMLAAWFRMKYPHICDGAIAASAPISQFVTPCDAFGRIVTSDYKSADQQCPVIIRKSWDSIDKVFKKKDGPAWISKQFKMCKQLDKAQSLKDYLNEVWTNVAMVNYPYPANLLMPLPGFPVKEVCKKIRLAGFNANKDPDRAIIQQIAAGAAVYFNYTGTTKCLDLENTDDLGAGMWDYQACTEMYMPMCTDGVNDMFPAIPWNFNEYKKGCEKRWKVDPRPKMATINYGDKDIGAASNIVFSNGLLDPWSSGGVMKNVNPSVISVLIPEGAHHLDLRGANVKDPTSVITARKIERQEIRKWIAQAHKKHRVRSYF